MGIRQQCESVGRSSEYVVCARVIMLVFLSNKNDKIINYVLKRVIIITAISHESDAKTNRGRTDAWVNTWTDGRRRGEVVGSADRQTCGRWSWQA